MTNSNQAFEKFIGIPWKEYGMDYSGLDCVGLVYLFYKDYLNVKMHQIPYFEFGKPAIAHQDLVIDFLSEENFDETTIPVFGDIVVFGPSHLAGAHVGIWHSHNTILHIRESHSSVLEKLYRIGMVTGYFNLKHR